MDFDIRKTFIVDPSWPPSMEWDAAYPYSGLIQHAYLTNKYNHYKKMLSCVTKNSNWK